MSTDLAYYPQDVDDVTLAFPAGIMRLLPPYDEIPEECRGFCTGNKWEKLWSDRFYRGLSTLELIPKDGVDPEKAWRHLSAICGSYEPKHEHKMAALVYLSSLWFEDATWEPNA